MIFSNSREMDVHIPCTNNYDLKDWIKHEIKCFFMLWLVFAFYSAQTIASNCILRCYSNTTPILHFQPCISLFGFSPSNFPEFVFTLASGSQAVYILALLRPPSTSTLAKQHSQLFSFSFWLCDTTWCLWLLHAFLFITSDVLDILL